VAVLSRPLVVPPHSRPRLALTLRLMIVAKRKSCRRRSIVDHFPTIVRRWHPCGDKKRGKFLRHLDPAGAFFSFPEVAQERYRLPHTRSLPSHLRSPRRLGPPVRAAPHPSCAFPPEDSLARVQSSPTSSTFAALRCANAPRFASARRVLSLHHPRGYRSAGLDVYPVACARTYPQKDQSHRV
jgi:hypothetical protein